MFSPEELNSVMRLNWPEQRIVHWHPAHLEMIELNKFDAENRELFTNYSQYLSNFVTKRLQFHSNARKDICHVWYMAAVAWCL